MASAASATAKRSGTQRRAPARRAPARRSSGGRSSGGRSVRPGSSITVRPGRLIALILLLVGVALYVGPLREFFAQQDRHQEAVAALDEARAENAALQQQVELLGTDRYIALRAREDSLLVPPGTQAFVVKGLPDDDEADPVTLPTDTPTAGSVTVLERVEDLWRTLLE